MHAGPFTAHRMAADQTERGTDELQQRIGPRQLTLVVSQALDNMHDAHRAVCLGGPMQQQADQQAAGGGQRETLPVSERFEVLRVAAGQQGTLGIFDDKPEQDDHGAREQACQHAQHAQGQQCITARQV